MLERLRNRAEDESGFTLIELLIVITILGILAAIVVFAVGTTGSNAKTTTCQADKKTVETATEAFNAATGAYPASVSALIPGYLREAPPASEGITTAGGVVAATAC